MAQYSASESPHKKSHDGTPILEALMTTTLLLRIVSVVALLQFVGHGTMFVRARPTHGPDEVAVVDAMRSHAFTFALARGVGLDVHGLGNHRRPTHSLADPRHDRSGRPRVAASGPPGVSPTRCRRNRSLM